MREALASSTNDFMGAGRRDPRAAQPAAGFSAQQGAYAARRHGGEAAAGRRGGRAGLLSSVSWLAPIRSGRLALGVVAVTVTLGVMINALALQDGDHPNPLFGSFSGAQPTSVGPRSAAVRPAEAVVARPPAAPVARSQTSAAASAPANAATKAPAGGTDLIAAQLAGGAATGSVALAPVAAARNQDAIGDLLRAGGAPMPPQRPGGNAGAGGAVASNAQPVAASVAAQAGAVAASLAPSPQVMTAQKQLARLGFGQLAADGKMGPGTRAAIERFQKAKGLPVTGELGPATLKALSASGGVAAPAAGVTAATAASASAPLPPTR